MKESILYLNRVEFENEMAEIQDNGENINQESSESINLTEQCFEEFCKKTTVSEEITNL